LIYAVEPDPRRPAPQDLPKNVSWHECAIGACDGEVTLWQSESKSGRPYTKSSSIKVPHAHFRYHPDIIFRQRITVQGYTLDAFTENNHIDQIDLIWADIQGAEGDMIIGGRKTLARTSYLYTEYSDLELYSAQPTLADILAMLPGWRPLRIWPDDVLLVNGRLVEKAVAPVPLLAEIAA
jgi:FkbM family methyltransferase